jgi:hypothetical protein
VGGGGATVELRGNSRDLSLQVVVGGINLGLVLDQEGAEDAVVDGDSALFDRVERKKKQGVSFKDTMEMDTKYKAQDAFHPKTTDKSEQDPCVLLHQEHIR